LPTNHQEERVYRSSCSSRFQFPTILYDLISSGCAAVHLRQLQRKTSIGLTPEARLAGMYPETAATTSNASAIPR